MLEEADPNVAARAQQAPNTAGLVIVVDVPVSARASGFVGPADGAPVVLQFKQSVVVVLREAIQGLEADRPPVSALAVINPAPGADGYTRRANRAVAFDAAPWIGLFLLAALLLLPPLRLVMRRAELAVRAASSRVREFLPAVQAREHRNPVQRLPVERVVAGLAVRRPALTSARCTAELSQRFNLTAPAALLLAHAAHDSPWPPRWPARPPPVSLDRCGALVASPVHESQVAAVLIMAEVQSLRRPHRLAAPCRRWAAGMACRGSGSPGR